MPKSHRKEQLSKPEVLSSEIYKQLLTRIELVDIIQVKSLTNLSWEKLSHYSNKWGDPEIQLQDDYKFTTKNKMTIGNAEWKLFAKFEKDEDGFLEINASYYILFSKKEDIPNAFWKIYRKNNLPLIVYPYFREFVQNITSRMNIPRLTLPLLFR
jgi:preprotein translocase subunit SecB